VGVLVDVGVVVGYLVAFLSGKAKRLADRAVDDLLERLYGKVASKLRSDPAMRQLEDDPSNDQAQASVVESLSAMAASNEQLTSELRQLVTELDRRGAQQLIISAPVHGQVFQNVTAQHGSIVGSIGRDVHIYQDAHAREAAELRSAGCLTKSLLVVGILLAFSGLGIFLYGFFTWNPRPGDPNFGGVPPAFAVAFGVFFTGFVLIGVSRMILGLRRRR
jgi:hypothetical protein